MTPNEFSRELNGIKGEIPVFFRDDDTFEIIPQLIQLLDIFKSTNIPLHISAIPARLSEDTASYLLNEKLLKGAPIEIGQHGFSHTNHSTNGLSEFCKNRSYSQQYDDIFNGKIIMQELFGDNFQPIFTPPYHGFDKNTLDIIQKLDFKVFSSTQLIAINQYEYRFKEVSINLDPIDIYEPQVVYKPEDAFLVEVLETARVQRYLGFNLHHRHFSEAFENQLLNLLNILSCQANIKFYHLSQFGNEIGSTDILFPTRAQSIKYYAKKLFWVLSRRPRG